ncbi:adenosine deaminase [Cryptosporangium aurantiacum]|uniref:Adenosine deaminase n=1 Tax=Cryptosporangium aurantiacum TaxID=134849 RepID=A0A1M7RBB3_9ACTN|nr:adenosine deaminase [Cryptosporangium aurantiacum]SHN43553.1 adenosine deaminase [Cryptosporangium aurantiacum]
MRDLTLLPKAHLHVHLESTLRPGTLAELAAAHGVTLPAPGGRFDGFRAFADHGALVRSCLREPEDFTRVAEEFCADEAAQGVGSVEVTFTAASHGERLGDPRMPLEAVLAGLKAGQAAHGIEVRVLLDHSRRRPVGRFRASLALAQSSADVVGVGVAGEESYPLAPFAAVCDEARDAGLHLVHHAGEACGAASIREALTAGHAERLGHGIRILEDPELVAAVRDGGVPLEVCPSSNVALGLVRSWAEHPLPALVEAGLAVTLNTDVPAVIGATLTGEYARVREVFGATDAELARLAMAGVDASFAPASTKERLRAGIAAWLAS